jgi:pyruvate dehydrogenase E2 component (dihydrolipoamide acetyltransferase)
MNQIFPIVVPKWGLEMEEGRLVAWHVEEGQAVTKGTELIDIETSKVTNTLESPSAGILRRKVAQLDETYTCGTLIGVIADATVTDEQIESFISSHTIVAKSKDAVDTALGERTLRIDGLSLRYVHSGQGGTPVLFIHGFGGDLTNWMFLQQSLAEQRATYAIDLPGHGRSDKDVSRISSFEDVASILLSFLDMLGIAKVHVVAHSMGAAIALAMTRHSGDRIATLSLLAPAALGEPVNAEFINGLITATSRRHLADVLRKLFANPDMASREAAEDMLKFKRLDGAEEALAKYADLLAIGSQALGDALKHLACPTNIIWGVEDKIIRPLTRNELPAAVGLTLLEGTGHMPHLEQSSATAEAIRSLIERQ